MRPGGVPVPKVTPPGTCRGGGSAPGLCVLVCRVTAEGSGQGRERLWDRAVLAGMVLPSRHGRWHLAASRAAAVRRVRWGPSPPSVVTLSPRHPGGRHPARPRPNAGGGKLLPSPLPAGLSSRSRGRGQRDASPLRTGTSEGTRHVLGAGARGWQSQASPATAAFGRAVSSCVLFVGCVRANGFLGKPRAGFGRVGRAESRRGRAKPAVLEARGGTSRGGWCLRLEKLLEK